MFKDKSEKIVVKTDNQGIAIGNYKDMKLQGIPTYD